MKDKDIGFVRFVASKEIKRLYKDFLFVLEDLDISEEEFNLLRKRVLDKGNDSIRNLEDQLDNYFSLESYE